MTRCFGLVMKCLPDGSATLSDIHNRLFILTEQVLGDTGYGAVLQSYLNEIMINLHISVEKLLSRWILLIRFKQTVCRITVNRRIFVCIISWRWRSDFVLVYYLLVTLHV
jgi:hypothetical protein